MFQIFKYLEFLITYKGNVQSYKKLSKKAKIKANKKKVLFELN